MSKSLSKFLTLLSLAVAAALPGAASAQATWNLYRDASAPLDPNSCLQGAANYGSYGNTYSCTGSTGGTVTASAWSVEKGATGNANALDYSGSYYANAFVSDNGTAGFGSKNRTETLASGGPYQHAVDNIPGAYDFILLDFGAANVVLESFGLGYACTMDMSYSTTACKASKADLTIMRWSGDTAPTRGTGTATMGSNQTLTDSGWQLVGSYQGVQADSLDPFGGQKRNTSATQGSSWWLISAFNTTLNGGTQYCSDSSGLATTCSNTNDAFKLNWIKTAAASVVTPGVPEPASLGLAMAALAALGFVRRQSKA
ncbi:PEP-CTERM domain-containing protein [Rubrivivax sp. A210]|uniref:PEP-CTERM sorting domain-containing protein n=1 Tax=Rubrivivax sp. A210 TaxID=2772301 RepID=UPI001918230C|nr:PEP-CTERM sorting domain-containing protein [Rubrivivax sp. A210]CAD5373404.1 PEP-CTERM domain-containing protein [Rubrivivax sp. A210]